LFSLDGERIRAAASQPRQARDRFTHVALAHVGYIFLTYRARVLMHSVFWSSDLVVFAFPTLLAFAGYISLLLARCSSWVTAAIVAIALTLLFCWISLFIAFNTYGT
jgi:hypothetical protein